MTVVIAPSPASICPLCLPHCTGFLSYSLSVVHLMATDVSAGSKHHIQQNHSEKGVSCLEPLHVSEYTLSKSL